MNMNTLVYEALGSSKVSWICCSCNMPNFTQSFSSPASINMSNSFSSLDDEADIPPPLTSSSPAATKINFNDNKSAKNTNQRKPKATTRHHLKVAVINFQGIRSKKISLQTFLEINQPDIVTGTESHIDDKILRSEIFPSDYNVTRKDRDTHGGGVLIALMGDLIGSHRLDLDSNSEVLWIQLEIVGAKPLLIGAFYRPQITSLPEYEYLRQLRLSLDKINLSKGQQVWI